MRLFGDTSGGGEREREYGGEAKGKEEEEEEEETGKSETAMTQGRPNKKSDDGVRD